LKKDIGLVLIKQEAPIDGGARFLIVPNIMLLVLVGYLISY
jgi:hypothetical protein